MCKHARISTAARIAAGVASALALSATLSAPALAGEYHVYSCRTPGGEVAPTDGWGEGVHSIHDVTVDTCGEGGGLVAGMDDGYAHAAHSASDKATWLFQAPSGEMVTGGRIWRAGDTAAGSNQRAYYAVYMEGSPASGEDEAFDVCTAWQPCVSEGNPASPLGASNLVTFPETVLPSAFIALDAACGSAIIEYGCPEGKSDPNGYAATIELFAADLILSDTESPAVSSVGGGLATSATVGGTSDVAFQADDSGSGVYEVVFRVDGQVLDTVVPEEAGGHCHDVGGTSDGLPAFLYTQPCPAAVSVDLPFDTTGVANGSHHLLVSVLDAAGNSTPVLDRQITVANAAAPAGGGTGEQGGSGGSGAGGGAGTGSGSGGSSSGAAGAGGGATGSGASTAVGGDATAAAPGPANGANASAQATLTASWKGHAGARLSGSYGAARVIEGRLTAPGGTPIAGAQLDAAQLPAFSGAKLRALAPPRTDALGHWRLVLPRALASGELRFAYRAHLGDALPAATRTLTLSVKAAIQLRIAPRVAPAAGTISFAGRLFGGPVPAGGKQVVLEARSAGGRWLQFHVIRGRSRDGRFHFAYRFRLPGPVRYQFRALCEAEADYPFAAGSSNVVGVYER
jgi:hypothetical protein